MLLRRRIAILLAALMVAVTGVQATVIAAVDNDWAAPAMADDLHGNKNGHDGDGDGGGDGVGGGHHGEGNSGEHKGQAK